jgi:hypothetical protein
MQPGSLNIKAQLLVTDATSDMYSISGCDLHITKFEYRSWIYQKNPILLIIINAATSTTIIVIGKTALFEP